MIGKTNATAYSNSLATLTVAAPVGATVSISKGNKKRVKEAVASAKGIVIFNAVESGTWTIAISDQEKSATKTVDVKTNYNVAISFNTIPEFNYTGSYEIVNDNNESITTSTDDWKIRFLTTGTLTFANTNGASAGIDVFIVGGGGNGGLSYGGNVGGGLYSAGGGGGGGGYRVTMKNIQVQAGIAYDIVVGGPCGDSVAFGKTAQCGGNGGNATSNSDGSKYGVGGSGGSSGGRGAMTNSAQPGDGEDGEYEFGGTSGKRYGAGGGGGSGYNKDTGSSRTAIGGCDGGGGSNEDAIANTGSGGGGESYPKSGKLPAGKGGSGIVIIRNARQVVTNEQINGKN